MGFFGKVPSSRTFLEPEEQQSSLRWSNCNSNFGQHLAKSAKIVAHLSKVHALCTSITNQLCLISNKLILESHVILYVF